jgi:hypothetical protein
VTKADILGLWQILEEKCLVFFTIESDIKMSFSYMTLCKDSFLIFWIHLVFWLKKLFMGTERASSLVNKKMALSLG